MIEMKICNCLESMFSYSHQMHIFGKMKLVYFLVILNLLVLTSYGFKVGTGIYDITGPSVEVTFMGYALMGQRGTGIHLRLRARSYAFFDGNKHACVVSVDGGMASDLVKLKVVEKLNDLLGEKIYTTENLAISGTHTHSGPAGFLQYVLFQVSSLGFVHETFNAWVDGIVQSVLMAHNNLEDASTLLSFGDLYGSNINRSPTSYLLNPESERNNYPEGDTDKRMFLLQFISKTSKAILGVLNWFAVHGTSMNNTNTLVSGDNRGYASYMLEKYVNGEDSEVGKGKFVAAFASTNLGDVSPNTNGAKCIDTGLPCDGVSSSCNGRCEKCIAFGPGTNGDNFESTQIIGNKQYEFAKALMANVTEEIDGVIDYRHSFVDMSKLNVTLADGSVVTLCRASMGYSFAAGTTDGPGMFGFTQGTTTGNPFWDKVSSFLSKPTQEEIDCQAPKPILLNTGDIDIPYAWDPQTVPIQIIRLGNVFVLAAPCELTTMAGRRLRNAVKSILREGNIVDPNQEIYVTISGLANSYASYVTTYEEYQAQRYEAASTLYGPHTLEGYIQEFSRLARDMVNGNPSTTGAPPADLSDEMIQLVPEPKFDRTADGASFGDVVKGKDVNRLYMPGETVSVTFHAANPRNNQRIQGSYLTVEYYQSDNDTVPVAHDGDWSTKFRWQAGVDDPFALGFSAISYATISWQIPSDAKLGAYRICYFGDSKESADATPAPFTGCSSQFRVLETITVIPKQG